MYAVPSAPDVKEKVFGPEFTTSVALIVAAVVLSSVPTHVTDQ